MTHFTRPRNGNRKRNCIECFVPLLGRPTAVAMLCRPDPCGILACSGLLQPLRHERRHLEDRNRRRGLARRSSLDSRQPGYSIFFWRDGVSRSRIRASFLKRDLQERWKRDEGFSSGPCFLLHRFPRMVTVVCCVTLLQGLMKRADNSFFCHA